MFSDIVQRFDSSLNALYRERDAREARGEKTIDLVSGNVNRAGFIFPPAILKQALMKGVECAHIYTPDPLGQRVAREAVAAYYQREGLRIPVDQILLTAGTSQSYAYLFRLLANAGDEILCPRPTYPLLNSIADLCEVKLTSYRLNEGKRWAIDVDSIQAAVTPRTRAIVLISPHNPTGAVATPAEITALAHLAARHNLPVISDEVFSLFLFQQKHLPRPASQALPLVFTLNGLSKMFALPGMKIGWIAVTGDTGPIKKAMHALDLISDTFLPVNEAVQFAVPLLFQKGKGFLDRYARDVQQRADRVTETLQRGGLSFVKPEGGFYLTIRTLQDEETVALDLLRDDGLLLHPGYFYDLDGSHLVLSFVFPPRTLAASLPKIIRRIK